MAIFRDNFRFVMPALVLATLAMAGPGNGAGAVELEKVVTKGPVTIALPKGWILGKGESSRILLAAQAPVDDKIAKDSPGQFQANLLITMDPSGDKVDATHQQEVAAKEGTEYQAIEKPTSVSAGNLKGMAFGGTFSRGNLKLRSRQYLFNVDGKLYGITFTCLSSSWAGYAPSLDASVATFVVK